MKLFFPQKDPKEIVDSLVDALGGRKLGQMLNFDIQGRDITITVKKLGTSVMEFSHAERDDGLEYQLVSEKIAMTHKPMKDEMMEKLTKIVYQVGGKVL